MSSVIPVVLFAYARPNLLRRILDCLRADNVPLLYVFSDGAASPDKEQLVDEVRDVLRAVDWCELVLCEREANMGLGSSILSGVAEVLEKHDAVIVFEDDLICVPGTFQYMCAALDHYKENSRVMSISAWTHPKVRPPIPHGKAYFDGRFACWGWGTWRSAWEGMDQSAEVLLRKCRLRSKNFNRYGIDISDMALAETERGLWAVRFALLHILEDALCFHPPHSLLINIGFSEDATNSKNAGIWAMDELKPCPSIPDTWPEPTEHIALPKLWQKACGAPPGVLGKYFKFLEKLWTGLVYKLSVLSNPEGVHNVILRRAVDETLIQYVEAPANVALDYGCGNRPYRDLLKRSARRVIAVDIGSNPDADCIIMPNEALPFLDASMDIVTSFQVMEHVEDFSSYLNECARVCRIGGRLILSVPSVWPLHPHPNDYRRWLLPGLELDLHESGFTVQRSWPILNPISAALQYVLSVTSYMFRRRNPVAGFFVQLLALFVNPLILVSEKCFKSTLRLGAGNYLVEAVRDVDDK